MPKISHGLTLAWLIAAQEAKHAGSAALEPEHFLAALTKVKALARIRLRELHGPPHPELVAAKEEGQAVHELFRQVGIDPDDFRRTLRKFFPAGNSSPAEDIQVHRSPRSHRVFEEAIRLVRQGGDRQVTCLHLLWAMVKEAQAPGGEDLPLRRLLAPHVADLEAFGSKIENAISGLGEITLKSTPADIAPVDLAEQLAQRKTLWIPRKRLLSRVVSELKQVPEKSVLLLGLPGTGRKTLVLFAARQFAQDRAGYPLGMPRLVTLPGSELAAAVGQQRSALVVQEAMALLVDQKALASGTILCLTAGDLLAVLAAEGQLGPLDRLRQAVATSHPRLLLVASPDELCRLRGYDPFLPALLSVVVVPEAGPGLTWRILAKRRHACQSEYGVVITRRALRACVLLSRRFFPAEGLPGKAVRLLTAACQAAQVRGKPREAEPAFCPEAKASRVTEELVAQTVALETGQETAGILAQLLRLPKGQASSLEEAMVKEVVGHGEAIKTICQQMWVTSGRLERRRRRGACFLLGGPPGVGKSHLAQAFARALHPSGVSWKRFDLASYSDAGAGERLFGPRPDSHWSDRAGDLVRRLRSGVSQVIVFEHVEKAHPEVRRLLARLVGKGHLHDPVGRLVDISRSVVFLCLTLPREGNTASAIGDDSLRELVRHLAPEFVDVVDEVVFLGPFSPETLVSLAALWAHRLESRIQRSFGKSIRIGQEVFEHLAKEAARLGENARSLRRLWKEHILAPLGQLLLSTPAEMWTTVEVMVEDGRIRCRPAKAALTNPPPPQAVCCDCGRPVPPGQEEAWRWLGTLYLCPECREQIQNLGVRGEMK